MNKSKLGLAVIINNLDKEQEPTKKDVEIMGSVLRDIGKRRQWKRFNSLVRKRIGNETIYPIRNNLLGFEVEIYRNLTSQGMNTVKRKLTEDKLHRDSNCFLLLIISHGTADNFLLDRWKSFCWCLSFHGIPLNSRSTS